MKLKVFFLFLCSNLFLQKNVAQKTHIIEPSILEVTYKTDCKYGVKKERNGDQYSLRCGKNVSQYFNLYTQRFDSLMNMQDPSLQDIVLHQLEESFAHPEDPSKQIPQSPGKADFLYTNLVKGKVSSYVQIMESHYCIEEDIPQIGWKLQKDTARNILGYDCMMGTTTFCGRTWVVWYAPDIAISLGPWKLSGLPGLILSAECRDFIDITATEIKTKHLAPVTFYNFANRNFEKIDRVKYLKAKTNPQSYPKGTKMTPQMEQE